MEATEDQTLSSETERVQMMTLRSLRDVARIQATSEEVVEISEGDAENSEAVVE